MRNGDSLATGLVSNGLFGLTTRPGTRHDAGPEGEMRGDCPEARRSRGEFGATP
jgi:hypothetical protein